MNKDTFRRMMEKMEDTFRDFEDMFQDVEREFGDQFGTSIRNRFGQFPVDIEETDNSVIVKADLPGMEKDRITVNAEDTMISIRAHDEREVREEGKNYLRQERSAQNYQRNIRLPVPVDPNSAEATYTSGVLTVTLDKADDGRGTEIDVK